MNPLPDREETIFQAAARLPASARPAFLESQCPEPALRRRIEALLSAHDAANGFMANLPNPPDRIPTIRLDLDDPDTQVVGQTIDRYKLLEKIGEGGCGVVYVAEQSHPIRRRVALKIIKLGMDTKQVVARFEAERQALALMDHPNIARVFDAGATQTGRPYFVMELVRGIRITDYCDQHHLSTRERLDLFISVCHAIQHAHQKGIIHRDIKPSNILVTHHDGIPIPKVIDFGIAKATETRLSDSTVYTQLHQLIGTPAYMSPEQAEMSGLDIDTRSDIYSLGVLLYELLVGRTPFDPKQLVQAGIEMMRRTIRETEPIRPSTCLAALQGNDLTATARHRRTEPPRLIHLLKGDLDWIVMKCLEKDRTRRYETANGLAVDIQRHLRNEPVVARPPSRTYRFVKTVRRNTGAFAAVAAVLFALLAGIITSVSQMVRAQNAEHQQREEARKARLAEGVAREKSELANLERIRAETSLYAADMNVVQQALAQQNLRHARARLRAHLPKPGGLDLRGWEWWYFSQLCRGDDFFSVHTNGNRVVAAVSSPLLNGIILGWENGTVELWNLATTRSSSILAQVEGGLQSLLHDPHGHTLVTHGRDGTVRVWNISTGGEMTLLHAFQNAGAVHSFSASHKWITSVVKPAERPELPGSDIALTAIVNYETGNLTTLSNSGGRALFSRDGKTLITGSWRGTITVWNTTNWSVRHILPGAGRVTGMAISPDDRWLATGSWEGSLILWDLNNGLAINLPKDDPNHVRVMRTEFSPDGTRLAASYSDGTIGLWDLQNRREIAELEGHEGSVLNMAFSPDGTWLISTDPATETTRLFKTQPRPVQDNTLSMYSRTIFSPDGRTVVVGNVTTNSSYCTIRNLDTGEDRILPAEPNPVGFTKDGFLVTATVAQPLPVGTGRLSGLKFWDIHSGTLNSSLSFTEVDQPVGAVALSPDGSTLAAGDLLGNVFLWDTTTGQKNDTLATSAGRVWNLVFSPDGSMLAVGIPDAVTVWDLSLKKIILRKPGLGSPIAISPDGKTLAMATETEVVLAHILSGETRSLKGHRERVYWLDFSPDGRTLASAAEDLKLWNLAAEREVASFLKDAHFMYVNFSPDGKHLVGGTVGQGHLWSAPRPEIP